MSTAPAAADPDRVALVAPWSVRSMHSRSPRPAHRGRPGAPRHLAAVGRATALERERLDGLDREITWNADDDGEPRPVP